MNNSYANQDLSYSDEDDDIVFQDQDDDVDMSYPSHSAAASNINNVNHFNTSHPNNAFNHLDNIGYSGIGDNGPAGQSNFSPNRSMHSSSSLTHSQAGQPTEKIRKKPGRKPGPTCPALRKEQNRAAQRAFRDRKERHLHQLENMIKDLKNQHFLVTSAYQREVHQLKAAIESLQSENYYLREVIFAFESALSKGNHVQILKDVKQELFRRHYESRAASASAKLASHPESSPSPSTPATSATPATPSTPVTPATPAPATPATPASPGITLMASPNTPQTAAPTTPRSPARALSPTATGSAASPSKSSSSSYSAIAPTPPAFASRSSNNIHHMDIAEDHSVAKSRGSDQPPEDGVYSMDGDILYKAPPLFIPDSDDGKLAAPTSPFAQLSVPRPTYRPPGTNLPKHTDYTKHPTVFDELQSSLFPPGTLESLHISMATPQEVVSDDSLFAEPMQTEEGLSTASTAQSSIVHKGAQSSSAVVMKQENDIYKDEEGREAQDQFCIKVAATLGLKKELVLKHRLLKEFRILAQGTPQCDPNIDPHIYQLPHDPRIDYIPCPKLRAQMIVHQHRYDPDEVFQLLIDEAVCHGPPLKKDSWRLPLAFFDRFGFLLGLELERIRSKMWPSEDKR